MTEFISRLPILTFLTSFLVHYYILVESISSFRGFRSFTIFFGIGTTEADSVDSDQMPYFMLSELGLRCFA